MNLIQQSMIKFVIDILTAKVSLLTLVQFLDTAQLHSCSRYFQGCLDQLVNLTGKKDCNTSAKIQRIMYIS